MIMTTLMVTAVLMQEQIGVVLTSVCLSSDPGRLNWTPRRFSIRGRYESENTFWWIRDGCSPHEPSLSHHHRRQSFVIFFKYLSQPSMHCEQSGRKWLLYLYKWSTVVFYVQSQTTGLLKAFFFHAPIIQFLIFCRKWSRWSSFVLKVVRTSVNNVTKFYYV